MLSRCPRPLPRFDALQPEARVAVLAASIDRTEAGVQRRLAHALRVSLPELASASGIPLHKVERALNRRRSDPRTLDRIRCTLGATETDVQAAQLVGLTRVCDPLRDDEAAP